MGKNEKTSPKVARWASEVLTQFERYGRKGGWVYVEGVNGDLFRVCRQDIVTSVAASALTQTPSRKTK